jgi:hypothetical protein
VQNQTIIKYNILKEYVHLINGHIKATYISISRALYHSSNPHPMNM